MQRVDEDKAKGTQPFCIPLRILEMCFLMSGKTFISEGLKVRSYTSYVLCNSH